MESPLLVLIFGIAVGILLTAKPLKEVAFEVHGKAPEAFPYIILGFLLFAATWALQWVGFTVVITTFVLYHIVGKGKIPIPSFSWPKRKPKLVNKPEPYDYLDPRVNKPEPPPPAANPVSISSILEKTPEQTHRDYPDHSSNQTPEANFPPPG